MVPLLGAHQLESFLHDDPGVPGFPLLVAKIVDFPIVICNFFQFNLLHYGF